MKSRTVSALAVVLVAALTVPAVQAQRSGFTYNPPAPPRHAPSHQAPSHHVPQRSVPLPFIGIPGSGILPMSNPIAPISNPIAPMANPVLPFAQQAFIRVIPSTTPSIPQGQQPRGRRGRGRDVVPTMFLEPTLEPEPLPDFPEQSVTRTVAPIPEPQINVPAPVAPIAAASAPRPRPTAAPPAIGTPRSEVLERFGKPWGNFQVSGAESLYFDNGLVVVFTNGRVSGVR
jgi:hypothetical protein